MTPPTLRECIPEFVRNATRPMTASEISKSIGRRGLTTNRVNSFLKGCDDIEYIPFKTIKSGPNKGKNMGAGLWVVKKR